MIANNTNTNNAASSEPSSGRLSVRVSRLIGTSRSSSAAGDAGGVAIGGEVALIVPGLRVLATGRDLTPAR